MKTPSLSTMVIPLMLFCTSVSQAQITKLNQLELFKQYNGYWKQEIGKDSTILWEGKNTTNGLEANSKMVTNGKLLLESKISVVYDKKSDKCIETQITQGTDTMVFAWWFTSRTISEVVPVEYLSNPENAPFRIRFEFTTPDKVVQSTIVNNKVLRTDISVRVK